MTSRRAHLSLGGRLLRAVALAALSACIGAPPPSADAPTGLETAPVTPITSAPEPTDTFLARPDFASAFDRVAPGVVGVAAGRRDGARLIVRRTGSGFVFQTSGPTSGMQTTIVTNDHLLGDAPSVAVRLPDGRTLDARIVGRDASTDLAVLQIDLTLDAGGPGPDPAPLAKAGSLRTGAWVAAIGNPMGLEQSITVGVVSALERRGLPGTSLRSATFIQTDVSLNPGSSGGPLVDGMGRVVGLNTAVLARAQGIAFATPIEVVKTVVEELMLHGRFVRGFAGIVVKNVRVRDAAEAGLPKQRGARVTQVVEKGPGDRAGLKPGDVILRFGQKRIDEPTALPWLIAATRPGEVIELRVARRTKRLLLSLEVAAAATGASN
ncbi:MAG: PDZ domain-containing protein [Myxococcales bacterium]|nr:PDZ domain-containing protein [Myxococcales bacterium]